MIEETMFETDRIRVTRRTGSERKATLEIAERGARPDYVRLERNDMVPLLDCLRSFLTETRACGHAMALDCDCAARLRR